MSNTPPPPLLPPFSASTAIDYVLIVASIAVGVAVVVIRLTA
jgi:hypothetical protein